MLACLDVDYRTEGTVAACVLFREWADVAEVGHVVERGPPAEPYEPGRLAYPWVDARVHPWHARLTKPWLSHALRNE